GGGPRRCCPCSVCGCCCCCCCCCCSAPGKRPPRCGLPCASARHTARSMITPTAKMRFILISPYRVLTSKFSDREFQMTVPSSGYLQVVVRRSVFEYNRILADP